MNARKSISVAACVLVSVFVFSSTQALAETHKFSKVLPAPTGGFNSPWGVAVGTGGEVFVSNNGNNVVDVYSPTDVFEKEFTVGTGGDKLGQLAVDHSAEAGDTSKGDLYIVDETAEKIYRYEYKSGTATEEGSISVVAPRAVAVDSKGNVYALREEEEPIEEAPGYVVDKYGPKEELIKARLIPETGNPVLGGKAGSTLKSSMAVDSSGNVYAASLEGVEAYDGETGACLNSCAKVGVVRRAGGVAVGPEGNIYESEIELGEPKEQEIKVYKPNGGSGELVENFDSAHLIKEGHGIAVSGTTVYETNSEGNEVAVFTAGPEFELEVKKTGAGTGKVECEYNESGAFEGCEGITKHSEGTKVKVKATAEGGSELEKVEGTGSAGSCNTNLCPFTLTENSTVTVAFKPGIAPTFSLTVFKAGEGKVTSAPSGIDCGATCSAKFVEGETVTLTESPKPGYEFAGWIGCKHVTATECEVTMTAAAEVYAVFLKEGTEGKPGEGVTTKAFSGNEHGCPEGGVEVKAGTGPATFVCTGAKGTNGTNGKEGAAGKTGAQGANGAAGAQGPSGAQGPAGPAGAQGPAGPAGQIQLVTCKTGKKKGKKVQQCTTKLVSGTVKFTATGASAHATLSRHGAVFAAGLARVTHGRLSLRLTPLRKLRAGNYTLTLISGAGRHETIRTEAFTLG